MTSRFRQYSTVEFGFSMLELTLVVFLTGLFATLLVPVSLRLLHHEVLNETAENLVWNLRVAQVSAQAAGSYGRLRFSVYTPEYWLDIGGDTSPAHTFPFPVNYVDGYLQMQSSTCTYDTLGNAQTAGTVKLTDGREVRKITLYMGAGLQSLEGDAQ